MAYIRFITSPYTKPDPESTKPPRIGGSMASMESANTPAAPWSSAQSSPDLQWSSPQRFQFRWEMGGASALGEYRVSGRWRVINVILWLWLRKGALGPTIYLLLSPGCHQLKIESLHDLMSSQGKLASAWVFLWQTGAFASWFTTRDYQNPWFDDGTVFKWILKLNQQKLQWSTETCDPDSSKQSITNKHQPQQQQIEQQIGQQTCVLNKYHLNLNEEF